MKKSVYLGLSILESSKILMYEFWYDCVKQKYVEKAKLFYIDADSFIVYIKADDIYKDIAEDVETRFHYTKNEFFTASCRFDHIYWRNPSWKTLFFV